MFIIRTLFWLSVVILLLPEEGPPSNIRPSAETDRGFNAERVIDAARTTVSDFAGICERSPQVCDTSEAAFHTFLRKARYGAELVYEMISGTQGSAAMPPDQPQQSTTGKAAKWAPPAREAMAPMSQNTLRPGDLEPEWAGPALDRPA
jgi:hypothetical protein